MKTHKRRENICVKVRGPEHDGPKRSFRFPSGFSHRQKKREGEAEAEFSLHRRSGEKRPFKGIRWQNSRLKNEVTLGLPLGGLESKSGIGMDRERGHAVCFHFRERLVRRQQKTRRMRRKVRPIGRDVLRERGPRESEVIIDVLWRSENFCAATAVVRDSAVDRRSSA